MEGDWPQKLPIYDTSEAVIVLEPATTPFEREIRSARLRTSSLWHQARSQYGGWTEGLIERERALAQQVDRILPSRQEEDVLPGSIYVGVATLTGSIMARNRNILLRILTPPTFLVASTLYFLPKTAHNINTALQSYLRPETHPTLHRYHQQLLKTTDDVTIKTTEYTKDLGKLVDASLGKGAHFVEESTGLKMGNMFKKEPATAKVESGVKERPEIVRDRTV